MIFFSKPLPPGRIWFPQIESKDAGDKSEFVVGVLRKLHDVFGNPINDIIKYTESFTLSGTTPLNIEVLIDFLKLLSKSVWAYGTFSKEQAGKYSVRELGFNLFDLPGNLFNYIHLFPSNDPGDSFFKQILSLNADNFDDQILNEVVELLKLSRCHQACRKILENFGHGRRDYLQGQSSGKLLDELRSLDIEEEKKWGWNDLPCKRECQLLKGIQGIFEEIQKVKNKEEKCPELAREVALLDCRKYRTAQSIHFANIYLLIKKEKKKEKGEKKKKEFARIIILDDKPEFRKQLRTDLRKYVSNENDIIEADPGKSLENCCLCTNGNADKIDKIYSMIKDEKIAPGDILCCFDLDLGQENIPKTAMGKYMKNIFGGQWILYKTALDYPQIPRLVITGFHSQDLSSHIAGSSAFLTKPYTVQRLKDQIENACSAVRHHVIWLCPKNIQDNYSNSLNPLGITFEDIKGSLTGWLKSKQVDLEVIESLAENDFTSTTLVILDILEIGKKFKKKQERASKIKKLRGTISKIRTKNPGIDFILVLPFDLEREPSVAGFYRQLPLNFDDGSDNVTRKPSWIVLDDTVKPGECLGKMIIDQLKNKGNFDVKYQVLVPVKPIVGRLAVKVEEIRSKTGRDDQKLDELYAPLLPYLVNAFGLSARISDIAEPVSKLKKKVMEEIKIEKGKEEDRWKNVCLLDVAEILDDFLEAVVNDQIKRHINLESWLRHIVDGKAAAVSKEEDQDIHTLTEPLARVFGGSTRYEFTVKGSWYKGAHRIDDILIVVEFCAKSSIIGNRFIRETVVKYLTNVGGEDFVLVQEIPIKGFLW